MSDEISYESSSYCPETDQSLGSCSESKCEGDKHTPGEMSDEISYDSSSYCPETDHSSRSCSESKCEGDKHTSDEMSDEISYDSSSYCPEPDQSLGSCSESSFDSDTEKSDYCNELPSCSEGLEHHQTAVSAQVTALPAESSGLAVQKASQSKKRIWDKKHWCPFCMIAFAKLPRHLEQKHSREPEVSRALSFPKKSRLRKEHLDEIRKRGNFLHNTSVIRKGEGTIVPCRRPRDNITADQYIPCNQCLGFFLKKDLWKHKKNCSQGISRSKPSRTRPFKHQQAGAALLPVCENASEAFREQILDTMATDEISLVIRNDNLITHLGMRLFAKSGKQHHQHQYIRQKLREIARLLLVAREMDKSVVTLSDCIDPTKFSVVVKAVKRLAGHDEKRGHFTTPSIALKLGHTLKKCAMFEKSIALQARDVLKKNKAESFLTICEVEWSSQISSQALSTLHEKTFNRPKRIPMARDIKTLNEYLSEKATTLAKELKQNPCQNIWRQLAEVTLAQITLFNRRRGGEMERVTLQDYSRGMSNSDSQEEIMRSLSPLEVELLKSMSRVEVRGKRGRKVPILLTERHRNHINLLNKKREHGGISPENNYMFPRPGESKTPIRSSYVLKKFALASKAEKPQYLTSTSLRKHIAVITQLLNLKNNELDVVARFMGHDINIHREFYRLPDNTLELAKVSKLLLGMEMGKIAEWKGKSLDAIEVAADGM